MFGKSWKTSLVGYLAAIFMVIGPSLQARATDKTAPPITVGSLAPAIAIAILGRAAKDSGVTGGTIQE